MTMTSTGDVQAGLAAGHSHAVMFLKCRKCGTERRARPPMVGELGSRVDRQVRCMGTNEHGTLCGTLMGMWSSSTGG